MAWLLSVALCNAVLIVPLAAMAWLVSRLTRSASISRLLWLLVMLKLIAVPLVLIPLPSSWRPLLTRSISAANPSPAHSEPGAIPTSRSQLPELRYWEIAASSMQAWERSLDQQLASVTQLSVDLLSACPLLLIWVWGTGTVVMTLHCVYQTRNFRRLIAEHAFQLPSLNAEMESLGRMLQLRRIPPARLVKARISPLLFGLGSRTVLLFPSRVWNQLPDSERRTLLLHELSHYQRGDHWVRLLECCCLCLYWWHPLAWWIKRKIEVAEELSCDEAVTALADPRVYARAIMDTIDMLAQPAGRKMWLTSGLDSYPVLHERLCHILDRSQHRQPGRLFHRCVLLAGMGLLPLQPTLLAYQNSPSPLEILFADPEPIPLEWPEDS